MSDADLAKVNPVLASGKEGDTVAALPAGKSAAEPGQIGLVAAAKERNKGRKKKSVAGALLTGDLKTAGKAAAEKAEAAAGKAAAGISALAGGQGGSEAAQLEGHTFNVDELNIDADGDGKTSAFEKAVYARMKRIDKDGDGKLSVHELYDVVEEAVAAEQDKAFFKTMFLGTAAIVVVMLACISVITAMLLSAFKSHYDGGADVPGLMANAMGQTVKVVSAVYPVPLQAAPVLDAATLYSVRQLQVSVIDFDYSLKAEGSYQISGVRRFNSTAVIFYCETGDQIKVWNGKAYFVPNGEGDGLETCAADVSCSAFTVTDATLAEAITARAVAALEEAGFGDQTGSHSLRRRLEVSRAAQVGGADGDGGGGQRLGRQLSEEAVQSVYCVKYLCISIRL